MCGTPGFPPGASWGERRRRCLGLTSPCRSAGCPIPDVLEVSLERFAPVFDACREAGTTFNLECHPGERAMGDLESAGEGTPQAAMGKAWLSIVESLKISSKGVDLIAEVKINMKDIEKALPMLGMILMPMMMRAGAGGGGGDFDDGGF